MENAKTSTENIIVSLGEDKGCFHSPVICLSARPFLKTNDCVDLVSFDVGTTHLAVARIRYNRKHKRCCIVNAVQMDIYHPWRSLMLDYAFRNIDGSPKNKRQRKPAYVEPFDGSNWPPWQYCDKTLQKNLIVEDEKIANDDNSNNTTLLRNFHKRLIAEKRVQREKEKWQTHRWVHDVELMPLALHNVEWLHDANIDRVLVEQQQYDNTKMRCISYCLLDMFQTRRVCSLFLSQQKQKSSSDEQSIPALGDNAALEMFPSTMKLSKWVINVLLQSWKVETDNMLGLSATQKKERKRVEKQQKELREQKKNKNDKTIDTNGTIIGKATEHDETKSATTGVVERSSDEVENERKQAHKITNRNNNNGTFLSAKRHDDLVDHATHGTKKTSAVRVLEHLFAPVLPGSDNSNDSLSSVVNTCCESTQCTEPLREQQQEQRGQHPLAHWLDSQRAEKHNVCDAILQAFAWLIKHEQEPTMQRIRKKRKRAVISAKSRKKKATASLLVPKNTVDDKLVDTKHTMPLE